MIEKLVCCRFQHLSAGSSLADNDVVILTGVVVYTQGFAFRLSGKGGVGAVCMTGVRVILSHINLAFVVRI